MAIKNEEIFEVFSKLVSIDSPSLQERKMADHVKALFAEIGVILEEDTTQAITGSDAGNLFGRIDAEGKTKKLPLFYLLPIWIRSIQLLARRPSYMKMER